ncbi:MFS transporter [Psychromicrobium lacuslunae]|uniref:MFS transporter n=1 Tax=Psychromicrobium lacuslunae TaxID=1618207 RepID=A0A0D4C231_9MICC|nr:MFS transporter [Psychromicrobium lacuslunae]
MRPPAGQIGSILTIVTMVHTLGQGTWLALNAVYVTQIIGLSAVQFGLGVSTAAAVTLALSAPMGHLADRLGPRTVQVISFILLAPAILLLLFVNDVYSYVAVMAYYAVAYAASRSARKAMIAGALPAQTRVAGRAYLRAASNVSVAIGAALAGLVLASQDPAIFRLAIILIAASFVATGLISLRLPKVPGQPKKPGASVAVLRDVRYLAFSILDGLLTSHAMLLEIAIPLWIVGHTDAPIWMITVVLLVNTAIVVCFQVRASRGVEGPYSAARADRQGGLLVALACLVIAVSTASNGIVTILILLAGALVHAVGELRQAVGSWGVSFDLAPPDQAGQYLGTHAMGADIAKMVAPAVIAWAILDHGAAGWIWLAVCYALCAIAIPFVVGRRPV